MAYPILSPNSFQGVLVSLAIVILASLVQLVACPLLLVFAFYSLAHAYQTRHFGPFNRLVLNSFIFGLPAAPLVALVFLWLAWFFHSTPSAYWFGALPVAVLGLYFVYLLTLSRLVPALVLDAVETDRPH